MGHQRVQQGELGGRQLQRPAVQGRLVPARIQRQSAVLQQANRGRQRAGGATQHGPHAGHHLARAKRLGDVVVRAQLQAHDAVGVLDAGGDHDDGRGGQGRVAAHGAGHIPAIAVGQHQVQHHQIGFLAANGMQRGRAVVGHGDLEAALLKIGSDQAGDLFVVVDDQDVVGHGER